MRYVIPLFFILSACSLKQQIEAVRQNNQGLENLKEEKVSESLQKFSEALAADPFNPAIHDNMGINFEVMKDLEKAIASYKNVEEMGTTNEFKFMARFNVAQALAKQSKIDEALQWYQKALELNPNSQEVKINIELLSQNQNGSGKSDKDSKDPSQGKEGDQDKDKDKNKDKDKQDYQKPSKYQPRPFKGELKENDVKKILGELKQQEQKIRNEYNRKEPKEAPHGKDW